MCEKETYFKIHSYEEEYINIEENNEENRVCLSLCKGSAHDRGTDEEP